MSMVDITGTDEGTLQFALFLLVKMGPTPADWLRIWAGAGSFDLDADAVDTLGGEYIGLGQLVGFPSVSQLINGIAERVEFTLSGVDAEMLELADSEAHLVRNSAAYLGFVVLDEDLQAVGTPFWFWEGRCDTPSVSRNGAGPAAVRQVTLSIGTSMTGRRRPRRKYWTGVSQRRDYPTDAGMDRVARYRMETTVRWPT